MSAARGLNLPLRASERTYLLRHGSVAAESREDRSLSVIDADGRIQLPPGWNELFPAGRAEIVVEEDSMRIVPPRSTSGISRMRTRLPPLLVGRELRKEYRRGQDGGTGSRRGAARRVRTFPARAATAVRGVARRAAARIDRAGARDPAAS